MGPADYMKDNSLSAYNGAGPFCGRRVGVAWPFWLKPHPEAPAFPHPPTPAPAVSRVPTLISTFFELAEFTRPGESRVRLSHTCRSTPGCTGARHSAPPLRRPARPAASTPRRPVRPPSRQAWASGRIADFTQWPTTPWRPVRPTQRVQALGPGALRIAFLIFRPRGLQGSAAGRRQIGQLGAAHHQWRKNASHLSGGRAGCVGACGLYKDSGAPFPSSKTLRINGDFGPHSNPKALCIHRGSGPPSPKHPMNS